MSAWEADAGELIEAGWGSHYRGDIPDDWRTRRGPDTPWGGSRAPRRPRRTYAEIRADRERGIKQNA